MKSAANTPGLTLEGTLSFAGNPRRDFWRAMAAGVIGNMLEWFDFGIYGILATTIGRNFFPVTNASGAVLAAFAAFGSGYVSRPLGSYVLGRAGDKIGRKAALQITVTLMAIATLSIGLVPNFESIGIVAPVILVLARLLQGFAAGGEWGGALTFICEWAPARRRGLYGSLTVASVSAGVLLGSGVAAALSSVLSKTDMAAWGWRIPFLVGGLLIPVALYLRRNVKEPPVYEKQANVQNEAPLEKSTFWALTLRAVCLSTPVLTAFVVVFIYMPSYATIHGRISPTWALWSNTISLMLVAATIPIFGLLSDLLGRKRILIASSLSLILFPYPVFVAMSSHLSVPGFIAMQLLLTVIVASINGVAMTSVAEMFPTRVRATGSAFSGAIGSLVAGAAPVLSTWMIEHFHNTASPAFILIGTALIALLAAWRLPKSASIDL